MKSKKLECLLRDDITIDGVLTEEAVVLYFQQYYPALTISNIKLDAKSNQAIITSNAYSIIQKQEPLSTPLKLTAMSSATSITSYKKLDEKGEDIGKLVLKYVKGIKKKVETQTSIEILCKLFENMENEIVRWKKMLNISISTIEPIKIPITPSPSKPSDDAIKKIQDELKSVFMDQIISMKNDVEKLDSSKTKLEKENKALLYELESIKSYSSSKQAGGGDKDKMFKLLTEKLEKEKALVAQINNLESQLNDERNRASILKSKVESNNNNVSLKAENDKLNLNIIQLEKKLSIANNQIDVAQSEKNSALKENQAKDSTIQKLNENINEQTTKLSAMDLNNTNITNELKLLKQSLEESKIQISSKSANDQENTDLKNKLLQVREESTTLKQRISELDENVSIKNNQLTKMTVQLSEKEEIIGKGISERNALNEKLTKTISCLEAVKTNCDSVEKEKLLQNQKIKLLEEKVEDIKALKDEYAKKIKDMEANKSEKDDNYKKYSLEKAGLEAAVLAGRQKIESLNSNKEKIEKALLNSTNEIESYKKKIYEHEQKINKQESEQHTLAANLQESTQKCNSLNDEIKKAMKEKATWSDKQRDCEEKIKSQTSEISSLTTNYEATNEKLTNLSSQYNSLKQANEIVIKENQDCTRKMEEITSQIDSYKKLLEQKDNENSDAKRQLQESQLNGNKLEKQMDNLKTLQENKEKLININKEELAENSKKIKDLTSQLAQQKEENATFKQSYDSKLKEVEQMKNKWTNEMATKDKEIKLKEMDIAYYSNLVEEQKSNVNKSIETYKLDIENLKKLLETKDSHFSDIAKKLKDSETKLEKSQSDHKKEIENIESTHRLKVQELEIKISTLEIATIESNAKMQELQLKPSSDGASTDDKLSLLMKENTDLQIKFMTIKREKESAISELNMVKKQLEKEKINKEIAESKINSMVTITETSKNSTVQLQTQLEEIGRQLKEKDGHIKLSNDETERVKEKLLKNEEQLKQANQQLLNMEQQLTASKLSGHSAILTILSKIKLPPSVVTLWDEQWVKPESDQELVSKIESRIVLSDIKGRLTEEVNFLRNLVEAYQTLYLISKTQLDKSGVKCDQINLLIESMQLYNEGTKEYQQAAIKKFKSVIPFMKDINIDAKNKDIVMKIVLAYVSCKHIRLNGLQDEFSQSRKVNLVAEQKRKEYDDLLSKYSDMTEKEPNTN